MDQEATPPMAEVIPHELEMHSDVRIDNYFWLRERDNPEVISYLEAENAYLDGVMNDTAALQEQLFAEMKGRIKEDDSSVPSPEPTRIFTALKLPRSTKLCSSSAMRSAGAQPPEAEAGIRV